MAVLDRKHMRGFASLTPERRHAIASLGGKASQRKGTAHRWTSEAAKAAGQRGHATRRMRRDLGN